MASAFAERRALLRSLRMLRRCTPSLHKLTDKQQRGVLGVHRRRCHRLAFEALFVWSRRTMARRRADRVLVRVTAAVDLKRLKAAGARLSLGQSCARRVPKFHCIISIFWAQIA